MGVHVYPPSSDSPPSGLQDGPDSNLNHRSVWQTASGLDIVRCGDLRVHPGAPKPLDGHRGGRAVPLACEKKRREPEPSNLWIHCERNNFTGNLERFSRTGHKNKTSISDEPSLALTAAWKAWNSRTNTASTERCPAPQQDWTNTFFSPALCAASTQQPL